MGRTKTLPLPHHTLPNRCNHPANRKQSRARTKEIRPGEDRKIKVGAITMELTSIALSLPTSLPSLAVSSSHSNFFTGPTTISLFSRTRPANYPLFSGQPRVRIGPVPARPRKGLTCNALFGLGVPELVVIAGVAALVFGPKKLPEVGRSIGKTVKSFQQAAKEFESELKKKPDSGAEVPGEKPTAVSEEYKQAEEASSSKESV